MKKHISPSDYAIIMEAYYRAMDNMDMKELSEFHTKMECNENIHDHIFAGIDEYYQDRKRAYENQPYEPSMLDEAYADLRSDYFMYN